MSALASNRLALGHQAARTAAPLAAPIARSSVCPQRLPRVAEHPANEATTRNASTVLRAVASQAGPPPPRAGKKKVKKMVDIIGEVLKDLSNGMFQVKLENGVSVIAHLSGKIRQNRIKVVVGDKVTVELSPYDLTKGRITLRHKPGQEPQSQTPKPE